MLHFHFTNGSLCYPSPTCTTTGKTTPTTTASTTNQVAPFPKVAGDSERGTGPDGGPPVPVGDQGSPDSEPISVEMEGKGVGCLCLLNFDLHWIALLGPEASLHTANQAEH